MKKTKLLILVSVTILSLTVVGYVVFEKFKEEISKKEAKIYEDKVKIIRNSLIAMIEEKEKSTLALAITMQNNYDLRYAFKNRDLFDERLKYITKVLNEKTQCMVSAHR